MIFLLVRVHGSHSGDSKGSWRDCFRPVPSATMMFAFGSIMGEALESRDVTTSSKVYRKRLGFMTPRHKAVPTF